MFKKIMSLLLIITVSFYDSLCSDYPKNNPVQETDLAKLNTAQLKESLLNQAKMLDEATYNETIEIFNFSNASLTSFAELFLKNSYKKEYCKIILKNLKAYIKNRKNFASVTANTSEPKGINTNKELLHQYRNKGVIEAISSILEKQESAYEKIQTVRKNLQHWIENFYKEQEGESFIKKMGRLESKEIQQTLPSEEIMNNNLEKILLNFKVNKIPKDISALELPEISDTTAVYYVKHFFNDGTNNQNAKKLLEQYSTNKKIQKNANTLKSKGIEEAYITYAYDQKMHFDTWFYKLPITDKLEI